MIKHNNFIWERTVELFVNSEIVALVMFCISIM